mgnify:CR=1 FL=1
MTAESSSDSAVSGCEAAGFVAACVVGRRQMFLPRRRVAWARVAGGWAWLSGVPPHKRGLFSAAMAVIAGGVWLERRAEAAARMQGAL